LLVTEVDFVVSFVHLECAPFGCSGNITVPIITNSDAHFRVAFKYSVKNYAGLRARARLNAEVDWVACFVITTGR
jgi:hypothetical protein